MGYAIYIYVPKGVRCPRSYPPYFRINAERKPVSLSARFLVADEGSAGTEGRSAPVR